MREQRRPELQTDRDPWADINYRDSSFDPRSYTLALNGDMDPYDASAD